MESAVSFSTLRAYDLPMSSGVGDPIEGNGPCPSFFSGGFGWKVWFRSP